MWSTSLLGISFGLINAPGEFQRFVSLSWKIVWIAWETIYLYPLSWWCHCFQQVNRRSRRPGSINSSTTSRLRDIVDYQTLIIIYLSIIQPDYCSQSQVWGCLGKGLSDKLQKVQNRAFRIITRKNYDIRSEDILNSVGFPNLQTTREHQLATLMYKIKQNFTQLFNRHFHEYKWNTWLQYTTKRI